MQQFYVIANDLSISNNTICDIVSVFLYVLVIFGKILQNLDKIKHAKCDKQNVMKVVVCRTNKKIFSIKVEKDVVKVTAFRKMTLEEIKQRVSDKREWINSRRKSFSKESCNAGKSRESNPDSVVAQMFCGKKCLLAGNTFEVVQTTESRCFLDGDKVCVPEKYYASKELRLKALRSFIKKLSLQNISTEVSKFGCFVSLCPTKIEFKNLSNGWLKCSNPRDRIITFDFRICQLPENLQRYLIVHAFCHFLYEGHDASFWNAVSNHIPQYRQYVEALVYYDFLKDI